MRIRANYLGVYKCWAFARPAIFDRSLKSRITLEHVRAVAFLDIQIGKSNNKFRNVAAGGSDLDRSGNRVAVILDQKNHRQFQICGGVQGFPPFSFAGRTVADRHINDLVAFETGNFLSQPINESGTIRGLGRTDRVQSLRTGT